VAVLFPGDVHELATFVLKACDARDRAANSNNHLVAQKSRPTLHGLAGHYAQVTGLSRDRVERTLTDAGLNLGMVVGFDPAD
jgi:hypothetical protein